MGLHVGLSEPGFSRFTDLQDRCLNFQSTFDKIICSDDDIKAQIQFNVDYAKYRSLNYRRKTVSLTTYK